MDRKNTMKFNSLLKKIGKDGNNKSLQPINCSKSGILCNVAVIDNFLFFQMNLEMQYLYEEELILNR